MGYCMANCGHHGLHAGEEINNVVRHVSGFHLWAERLGNLSP